MKYKSLIVFSLLLYAPRIRAQIEVPESAAEYKIMQKGKYTYAINPINYDIIWTATKLYSSDIEQKKFIPHDAEFFPANNVIASPIWLKLEDQVKLWTIEFDSIYVVTGLCTIKSDSLSTEKKICYKAVLKGCQGDAIGFLMTQDSEKFFLKDYIVNVDEIEEITGLNFFPDLNKDLQDIIESTVNTKFWPIEVE